MENSGHLHPCGRCILAWLCAAPKAELGPRLLCFITAGSVQASFRARSGGIICRDIMAFAGARPVAQATSSVGMVIGLAAPWPGRAPVARRLRLRAARIMLEKGAKA